MTSKLAEAISSVPLNIRLILNNKPDQMRKTVDLTHTIHINKHNLDKPLSKQTTKY